MASQDPDRSEVHGTAGAGRARTGKANLGGVCHCTISKIVILRTVPALSSFSINLLI